MPGSRPNWRDLAAPDNVDLGGVALRPLKKGDNLRVEDFNPVPGQGNVIATDSFRSAVVGMFSVANVNEVSIDLGDFGGDKDRVWLRVFDSSRNLIGGTSGVLAAGVTDMVRLTVAASDIAYVAFGSQGRFKNSVYADNLTFSTDDTTAVPLPAGFLLLGTALAGLGLMRRRRRA
jgi:hypothetical protein